jgi:ankyrin repeat protein
LHLACQEDRLDIIKFLLDSKADINKQSKKSLATPLHVAINDKHFAACKLILGYEQVVSDQNLERGIVMAKERESPEIQVLLEKELERRQDLIQIDQYPKPTQKNCSFCKEVPEKRKKCGKCKIAIYCSKECQSQHWTNHKLECSVE